MKNVFSIRLFFLFYKKEIQDSFAHLQNRNLVTHLKLLSICLFYFLALFESTAQIDCLTHCSNNSNGHSSLSSKSRINNPYTCCTNPTGEYNIPVAIHVIGSPQEEFPFPDDEFMESVISMANEHLSPYFTLIPILNENNCSSITFRPEEKFCCLNVGENELEIKNLSRKDPNSVLNIWVVKEAFMENGTPGNGFAYLPQEYPNSLLDGIVLTKLDNRSIMAELLVHEFGHYMGLLHVWGKNQFDPDNCTNEDPCNDGDEIADTEPNLGPLPNASFGAIINADCSYTQAYIDLIVSNNQTNPFCPAPGFYPCKMS